MSPPRRLDSDLGKLVWWGTDCLACGNATPGSRICDSCGSDESTVALWTEERQ